MPSFPPKKHGHPDHSQRNVNKDNNDHDYERNDRNDGEAQVSFEEKMAIQIELQMRDLGNPRRNEITQSDVSRAPRVPLSHLQRDRAVNEPGSEANEAFMAKKTEIRQWTNFHTGEKSNGFLEDLDPMLDGQSHRARLREVVDNSGGQQYDLQGTENPSRHSDATHIARGGTTTRGGRGGGNVGTRGRGGSASPGQSTTRSGAGYRPLDPAVEPDTDYAMGRKRDLHRGRGARQGVQFPAHGSGGQGRGSGRGGRGQDVRGNMVGRTVRVTAASTGLPMARQLAPGWTPSTLAVNPSRPKKADPADNAPTRRVPPVDQDGPSYKKLLDPAAFLAAIASNKDREAFNKMIPSQPRPAKSKVKKPTVNIPEVAKLNPTNKEERTYEESKQIRKVTTHEIVFPPPSSKSRKSFDEIDAYTDGVLSPGMSNISSSRELSPVAGSANVIEEGNDSETTQPSSAIPDITTPEFHLGISDQSVSVASTRASVDVDLLKLNTEEVSNPENTTAPDRDPPVHGAAADLMDLDFGDVPQGTLTPDVPEIPTEMEAELSSTSKEPQKYVVVDGEMYLRRDQFRPAVAPVPLMKSQSQSPSTTSTTSLIASKWAEEDHNAFGSKGSSANATTTGLAVSKWARDGRSMFEPKSSSANAMTIGLGVSKCAGDGRSATESKGSRANTMTTSLSASKWAEEGRSVFRSKGSSANAMLQGSKTGKNILRTNAGPGFALLEARLKSEAAASGQKLPLPR